MTRTIIDKLERADGPDREVHILVRHTGSYDDYRTTPIAAYLDLQQAEHCAHKAGEEFAAAVSAFPGLDYPDADDEDDEAFEQWEADREDEWARFKSMLTIDPSTGPTSAWDTPNDDIYYTAQSVPIIAALRARSQGGE